MCQHRDADGIGLALVVVVAVGLIVASLGLVALDAVGFAGFAGSILTTFAGTLAAGFAVARMEQLPASRQH